MTTAHTLQRSTIVGLAALVIAFALTGTASAGSSTVPDDVVLVSSTVLGSGSFTMTATNFGSELTSLDLAAPGVVWDVLVDHGFYDGRWTIGELGCGATATMTGSLAL